MSTLISLVIPAYNEQENIRLVYQKIVSVLLSLPEYAYEIIFIDDGSVDATWRIITELAADDSRVKGCKFSRNFGHQRALTAGYDRARGDAIISMDADLQDPPALLASMICAWQEGAHIVYARRINRQDGWLKKCTAHCYYALLWHVSDVAIPRNVGDFRLIDKRVLQQLSGCKEKARYVRGMVAWTGFKHAYVDFERPNRHAGNTGYTWKKMVRLACDGMTSFSTFPLTIIGYVGVLLLMTVFGAAFVLAYNMLVNGVAYASTTWFGLVMLAFLSVQSIALWLLGEYVGRIYQEAQNRPLYIVEQECNAQKS